MIRKKYQGKGYFVIVMPIKLLYWYTVAEMLIKILENKSEN